ncbi:hypothetical protein KAR91_81415 [Candidatus Pacearchaeota archaeon]|nr:hypothetical protein [Candidatus Pacearchaeota archaeon]
MNKGDKIKFTEEKQAYTIQAKNKRFLVCTKPFNPRKTVLYTIVDLVEKIRGTEDLIFCMGFETVILCEEALKRIVSGESRISERNQIPLCII